MPRAPTIDYLHGDRYSLNSEDLDLIETLYYFEQVVEIAVDKILDKEEQTAAKSNDELYANRSLVIMLLCLIVYFQTANPLVLVSKKAHSDLTWFLHQFQEFPPATNSNLHLRVQQDHTRLAIAGP